MPCDNTVVYANQREESILWRAVLGRGDAKIEHHPHAHSALRAMTRSSAARLPFEMVDHIFAFGARDLPLDVCRHVRALKRALHDGCARRVQQWFRRHRLAPDAPPCPLTKRVLIRYYAAHYPEEFLLSYPEFIVHKCGLDRALLRDHRRERLMHGVAMEEGLQMHLHRPDPLRLSTRRLEHLRREV